MRIFKNEFGIGEVYRDSLRRQEYRMPKHMHQFSEIINVFEGEVCISVDGRNYTLKKGDAAIIAPFQIHEVKTVGIAEFWICVFSNNCVPDYSEEPEFFYNRERAVFIPSKALNAQISEMLDKYPHPLHLSEGKLPHRIKSVLYALLTEFSEAVPGFLPIKRRDVLSSVILYVNEHYLEKISLASVGKALGYNTKYLSQCIGEIPNMNFPMLLNSLRTDHAKKLLMNGEFNIIDIAYECGFESEQSFYRVFRKITGTTPGKYRRLNLKQKQLTYP